MNTTVTATGMEVTVTVDSNLLIGNTVDATEATLATTTTQTVTGLLQPVSTTNGANFFYADSDVINGDGSSTAGTGAYFAVPGTDAAFATAIGVPNAKRFVVYDVVLKAVATADVNLVMNKLDLTYTASATETDDEDALRVAVLASTQQTSLAAAKSASTSLKTILGTAGADYFEDGKAVTSTSALGTVTNFGTDATIDSITAGNDPVYYRVQVILWLEGEDETCTNVDFIELAGTWALDIGFSIASTAVAVDEIANS